MRIYMDLDSVSVNKHAKKELGQYPAILASSIMLTRINFLLRAIFFFQFSGPCRRFTEQLGTTVHSGRAFEPSKLGTSKMAAQLTDDARFLFVFSRYFIEFEAP